MEIAARDSGAPPPVRSGLTEDVPVELLLKMVGLGDLMRVLATLHAPLRGIRQLVAEDRKALYQALVAFAAFLTIVPFVHKEVIMRLGSLVSYPLVAQGSAVENATVMHIIAIVSGILGFMLMYALPKSLYAPSTRSLVVATNIYATMYSSLGIDWKKEITSTPSKRAYRYIDVLGATEFVMDDEIVELFV